MRVGIFSDVHGNGVGLDAVLADLERAQVDRLVCLGDLVEGGPQPACCVRRMRELDCLVVLGNADEWLLSGRFEPGTSARSRMGAWALEQLDEADRDLMRGFAATHELELGGGRRLLAVHGTPTSTLDTIEPDASEAELAELLGEAAALAAGHTHLQWQRRLGERVVLNPGRVGGPFGGRELPSAKSDHDGTGEYAILTADETMLSVELRHVDYSLEELRRVTLASGMPHAEEAAQLLDVS
ncbi:MAG TPA: metallophosphoesterase family protein [Gaiellaceae bacterium]|jgi:predicted phosphodiesterase|nr:metallophosphoesterase family protein [Gaiellaceae bacterium]